jgi:hypothetical protein
MNERVVGRIGFSQDGCRDILENTLIGDSRQDLFSVHRLFLIILAYFFKTSSQSTPGQPSQNFESVDLLNPEHLKLVLSKLFPD